MLVGFWPWAGRSSAVSVAAAVVAFVTSNGVNKSSNVTLSGGNLTETGNVAVNGYQCVRADAAKAGKRQAEFTINTISAFGPSIYLGVDDSSLTFATDGTVQGTVPAVTGVVLKIVGNGPPGTYTGYKNGAAIIGGTLAGGFQAGDVISMVYDSTTGDVTFYRTRSGSTVIIDSAIPSVSMSTWTAFAGGDNDNAVTANFGATAFARALDSGYSSYAS